MFDFDALEALDPVDELEMTTSADEAGGRAASAEENEQADSQEISPPPGFPKTPKMLQAPRDLRYFLHDDRQHGGDEQIHDEDGRQPGESVVHPESETVQEAASGGWEENGKGKGWSSRQGRWGPDADGPWKHDKYDELMKDWERKGDSEQLYAPRHDKQHHAEWPQKSTKRWDGAWRAEKKQYSRGKQDQWESWNKQKERSHRRNSFAGGS